MTVRYPAAPTGTVRATVPGLTCGNARATRDSVAHTRSGASAVENVVSIATLCGPGGRLRLMNDVVASIEFGMMRIPAPVSMCTERQFTSTTRPLVVPVSSQSSIRNGCSNNMNKPETIWPMEFCSIRPMTTEVMPSAVNSPPIRTPQM